MEHMALVNTVFTVSGVEQSSSHVVMVCAYMSGRSLASGHPCLGPAVNCSQKAYLISSLGIQIYGGRTSQGIQIYANLANVPLQLSIIPPLVLL